MRKGFLRKVYFNLFCQLLATVIIAALVMLQGHDTSDWLRSHEWMLWLAVSTTFGLMCVMICCTQALRKPPLNFIVLILFTMSEGIMIGFCGAMFAFQTVMLAVFVTVGVFGLFTFYAFYGGDFTGWVPYLFGVLALIGLFGFALVCFEIQGTQVEWIVILYDAIGVLMFTMFVVFDTQLIIGEWGGHATSFSYDEAVFASLNLYMDIPNMFVNIVAFIGKGSEDANED
jgi:hypothetical protein